MVGWIEQRVMVGRIIERHAAGRRGWRFAPSPSPGTGSGTGSAAFSTAGWHRVPTETLSWSYSIGFDFQWLPLVASSCRSR